MSLLQHEFIHLTITSLVCLLIYYRFRRKSLVFLVFLIGIFLDVDHLLDYLLWSGGQFVLSEFLNPSLYVHLSGKVYVPFHGFEIGLVLWVISRWVEKKFHFLGLSLALTLSYFAHLLWDNFSFQHHPLAYFIIYRFLNKFSISSFDGI